MKVGDTVRYLNSTGVGVITRIDGKIAFVEEDGFETPVLMNELVVVIPAGYQPKTSANLMFDEAARSFTGTRDKGQGTENKGQRDKGTEGQRTSTENLDIEKEEPVVLTPHGDKLNIALAFEPQDIKSLSSTTFAAILVNDSNYWLDFQFLTRSASERTWHLAFRGSVAPNELIDLAEYTHEDLPSIEYVALRALPAKRYTDFELKAPINFQKRLDITKFHKLHCFNPGLYFDTPVLEIPVVKDDVPAQTIKDNELKALQDRVKEHLGIKDKDKDKDKDKKSRPSSPAPRPSATKLLPPIEVDLHIGELLDSTAGMEKADILNYQLDTVRRVMKENERRKGQKIIFIHGKGEGVLREAVRKLLRHDYPRADLQDASFREYGFGATLVTVH